MAIAKLVRCAGHCSIATLFRIQHNTIEAVNISIAVPSSYIAYLEVTPHSVTTAGVTASPLHGTPAHITVAIKCISAIHTTAGAAVGVVTIGRIVKTALTA